MKCCKRCFAAELFYLDQKCCFMSKTQDKAIRHVIIPINMAARLIYAQRWKLGTGPTKAMLRDKIFELVEMNILTERWKQ